MLPKKEKSETSTLIDDKGEEVEGKEVGRMEREEPPPKPLWKKILFCF